MHRRIHSGEGISFLPAAIAIAAALLASALLAVPGAAAAAPPASASIVGGSATTIEQWPWQVALATAAPSKTGSTPQDRTFCGGTLVAPTMVVTAAHCAYQIALSRPGAFTAITGRTKLNDAATGQELPVADTFFPTTPRQVPRFQPFEGDLSWDIGLVELAQPSAQQTIAVAGPDESALWKPGRVVYETGYGITGPDAQKASNVLKLNKTALQQSALCKQTYLFGYRTNGDTMLCLGSQNDKGSSCNGDSGGPLVVPLSGGGYRLLGSTSFGETDCGKVTPSVDARLFGAQTRDWIAATVAAEAGVDPVGSGGRPLGMPTWCRTVDLDGKTVSQAKKALRKRNCRLGKVKRKRNGTVREGRVFRQSTAPNWIKVKNWKVAVTVAR